MPHRIELPEGYFIYVLGLVVIASRPDSFWLGFSLAATPILAALVGRVAKQDRARRRWVGMSSRRARIRLAAWILARMPR
ncbi:MAG: hypothetical protein ACXVY6_03550 [Gaiellaceae bacterium]